MGDSINSSTLRAAADSSAAVIGELGIVLYVGGTVIFCAVLALAVYGVWTKPRAINAKYWIVGAGLAFPIVTVSALLAYSIVIGNALHIHAPDHPLRIHVQAKQWWWQVDYEVGSGQRVTLANELHIPTDTSVELILTTSDVIHSFWVPALAGKVDMIPGHTNRLILRTSQAGVYRGQCAEFCGLQHALMALFVVAKPKAQFDAWLTEQSESVKLSDAASQTAFALFERGGCAACHTIRGTAAAGTLGPDL
ncbi:MAG TPA: cytochrome c oxidase subunit II, partial [Steroidobacteraceae bacterium]|nr:cytochrome c oxidase subunit II [Steroidobacteraceae bacterium]